MLGVDGIADFNALHSRRQDEDVQLYAFDILALDGEELRSLPSRCTRPTGFLLGASIRQSNTECNMQAPLCAQRSSRLSLEAIPVARH